MISGTAAKRKCYPLHAASERLTQPVRDNLLSFHALTGCSFCVTYMYMAHMNSQRSTMPGSNSLARPRRVWRRYHQQERHCNFTQYVLTTRQKIWLQADQEHIICPISHWHCSLEGVGLPRSCVDKTSSYPRCLSGARYLQMQIKVQDSPVHMLQKGL